MAVWRNTTYTEAVPESPEESLTRDASRTQRAIFVEWGKRFSAVRDFVGFAVVVPLPLPPPAAPGLTANAISRQTPHRHPEAPFMVCTGCTRIQGISFKGKSPDDVAKYELAKLYLNYESPLYDVLEDNESLNGQGVPDDGASLASGGRGRFITPLFTPGGKYITIPRGQMRWAQGGPKVLGKIVTFERPRFIPEGEFTLNWTDVPTIPFQAILNCVGKVNEAAFAGFPAETLLMLPPRLRPTMSPLGERTSDILYQYKWLPNRDKDGVDRGHNYDLQYDPDTQTIDYKLVTSDGTVGGDRLFRTADFRTLFRPDQ